MSKRLAVLIAAVTAAMVLAPSSWAGTEQDPEVADECDDGYIGGTGLPSVTPPPAMNVLSAWFEEVWEPGDTEGEQVLSAVKVTLRVCANLDSGLPVSPPDLAYGVAWDNGECRQGFRLIRRAQTPTRVDARQTCSPSPTELVTLPTSDYRIDGDRMTVTLRVDGPAGQVIDGLSEGQTLGDPQAFTWFVVGGSGDGSGNTSVEGDTTPAGRSYVIGQHKPA